MCIQLNSKNKIYEISKRNFLDDYANYKSQEIDMTLSGKYLYEYPKFTIDYSTFSEYPTHKDVLKLTETIKKIKNIHEKEVVIGTGANGLLQNLVKILFREGGNLITPYLTFNQPEYAVTTMNGSTKRVYMEKSGQISLLNIIKSIDEKTKMIYICNPNNPTGMLMNNKNILEIAKSTDSYVVIDESAIEFSEKNSLLNEKSLPNNIIIVRSLSKAYGISNLRIGYIICSKELKKLYEKNVTVNEVSGISCQYAIKVLLSDKYKKNIKMIIDERKNIEENLKDLGIKFFKSQSNILCTKNQLNDENIKKLYNNNVSVMKVYDENNVLHMRIAIQEKDKNEAFIRACKKVFIKL